jgi:ankyrin repeat protein
MAGWSTLSLWNHVEYTTRAKPLFLKARQDLAEYYQALSGMTAADAMTAAHLALWEYMESTERGYNNAIISPLNSRILNDAPLSEVEAVLVNGGETWNSPGDWTKNDYQDPPLQNAVTRPDVVKMMLGHHADPNLANRLGRTPLMTAALYDNLDSLNLLLAAGADVNRQSAKGAPYPHGYFDTPVYYGRRTALMYAAANASRAVIESLLEHGADRALKDDWGLTAQDYLMGRGPVPANPILSPTERKLVGALLSPAAP